MHLPVDMPFEHEAGAATSEDEPIAMAGAPRADASPDDAPRQASAAVAFLATVSHELRTPVNAIIGYHELLDLGLAGPLTDKQRAYLGRASTSARHLLTLVDEVLDFAKLDADRLRVAREAFVIGDIMADALTLVAPQASQRRVAITDASGAAANRIAVWGDRGRVKQIIINLLSNAVKFTEPLGESTGRLTVTAGTVDRPPDDIAVATDGPAAFLRVEDTGPGIPADRIQSIFEPFMQGDPALTRRYGGSGLGLPISRRLARLMGGDLTVRSDLGMGSTFLLWLPAAPLEAVRDDPFAKDAATRAEALSADAISPIMGEERPAKRSRTFVMIADALIQELEPMVGRYLERLRLDPFTLSARNLPPSRIEDHLVSFIADLAATLDSWEVADRELTDSLLDSSAIQRTIASKHGEQRARLGWQEEEVRREYVIIEEELTAVIRRTALKADTGETDPNRANDLNAATLLMRSLLAAAQRRSVESFRTARRP